MTNPRPPGTDAEWLLSAMERGNDSTQLQPWTAGNSVRVLAHGDEYFARLAVALESAGAGDLVLVAGFLTDADQVLNDDGLTVVRALQLCLSRGVSVKGLIWRSHPSWLTGSLRENRSVVIDVNRAGGELFLDHRVRRFGSHHQKFVVIRHATAPDRDVAFVGGIDLARSRRDSAAHDGDPRSRPFAQVYGPRPAWHDVALELRGPVVTEVEEVFRERWNDPQPMTRLPWHRIPDTRRGLPQTTQPLEPALAAPAPAGRCNVQLLRTYPRRDRRTPSHPKVSAASREV